MFFRGLRRRWEFRRIRNYVFLGLGLWFLYVIIASEQGILRIVSFRSQIEEADQLRLAAKPEIGIQVRPLEDAAGPHAADAQDAVCVPHRLMALRVRSSVPRRLPGRAATFTSRRPLPLRSVSVRG